MDALGALVDLDWHHAVTVRTQARLLLHGPSSCHR